MNRSQISVPSPFFTKEGKLVIIERMLNEIDERFINFEDNIDGKLNKIKEKIEFLIKELISTNLN